MRTVNEINVHCTATKPEWMAGKHGLERIDEIRRWHVQQNGWRDIGYHWIVDRDGQVYSGRDEVLEGAFEPKVNKTAIGVCLIGGFGSSATDNFAANFTPEQDEALRGLIADLHGRYRIAKVTGHNDYAAKACPGFKVDRWLNHDSQPRKLAQSKTVQAGAVAGGAGVVLAGVDLVRELRGAAGDIREATAAVATDAAQAASSAAATVGGLPAGGQDILQWVLLALIIGGCGMALYRRWVDWQNGRQ
jgi:N-acetylmuramoyl-L-alanine amidase